MKAIEDLSQDQPARKEMDTELWSRIDAVIQQLQELLELRKPFIVVLDDPSGNSYIENFLAPRVDPKLAVKHYRRTKEQDAAVGIFEDEEEQDNRPRQPEQEFNLKEEVLSFPANCSNCSAPCDTKMKVVDIPYFKEVVIMSTTCDSCGYKSNEVKAGGAVAPKGRRITLKVADKEDLSRDVLKVRHSMPVKC